MADPNSLRNERPDFLAPPHGPDELGRLGSYRVLKVLGRGGMGMVFLADDPHLKRAVALKVMLPHVGQAPTARERFLREARAAATLEHDHIIPIYQVAEDHGVTFIAMPYLKGLSLQEYLKKKDELSIPQILRIGREVAKGLAAAHEKGLIHRDIKPANLWLDANAKGRVKILDFGLARSADGDELLTQEGTVLGTPAYMSPEQAAGKPVGTGSDLFSLGAVLYRLCTGRRPFSGPNTYAILTALATEHPPPLHDRNPAVMPAFADLVMQLLEKEPARRPASAKLVAETIYAIERDRLLQKLTREASAGLVTVGGSHAVSVSPDDSIDSQFQFDDVPPEPVTKRRPGRSLGLSLAGGGAVVAAAVVAGILLSSRPGDRPVAKAGAIPEGHPAAHPMRPVGSNPGPASAALPPRRPAESQWEHLFNGTDLTGWRLYYNPRQASNPFEVATVDGGPAVLTKGVEASMLVSETPSSDRTFENYHLRCRYKLQSGQSTAALQFHNTGTSRCYLMLHKPGKISWYNATGRRTWDEAVWDAGRWRKVGPDVSEDTVFPFGSPAGLIDRWHEAELYCVGETAVPVLDGHVLGAITNIRNVGQDSESRKVKKGSIGIVAWAGVVVFRQIDVRPITDIPEELKVHVPAKAE